MNSTARKKTVLITGTSSGFGQLVVPSLLAKGFEVIAGIRGGQARLERIFPEACQNFYGHFHAVDIHMERPETFQLAKELIDQKFEGKLDILINNAGYGLLGPFEDQTTEQIRAQFEVNFFGPALLTRELIPALRKARGRIINVSSICGLVSFPFYGTYTASKFALEAHTEGLYYELKPFGIQVGLIEPGGFQTEFAGRSLNLSEGSKVPQSLYYQRAQAFERVIRRRGKHLGDPQKVAQLMLRLCEKRKMPLRSVIGTDAAFMVLIRRFLPEGWRAAAEEYIFRKFVFRD